MSRPRGGAWIETVSDAATQYARAGRAPAGARGLKLAAIHYAERDLCRAPAGARGLKHICERSLHDFTCCRAPAGARGLKPISGSLDIPAREVAPPRGRVD